MPSPAAQPTILVVEDDASLRQFYRTVLKNAGYHVVAAADGLEALHFIEQHTPSLIVLDLPPTAAAAQALVRTPARWVVSLLRQAGFWALTAGDGLVALRCIEDRPVAAVVLDLVLPRLSGRDVYREMKARPDTRDIPIIVVSGDDVSDRIWLF